MIRAKGHELTRQMDVYIEKQLGKKQRKSEQAQEAAESGGSGGPGDGAQPQLAMKPTKLD